MLGVSRTDDESTIRRRYHALARDQHPDAGGDADAFQRLRRAYAVLVVEAPEASKASGSPNADPDAPRRPPPPDPRPSTPTVDIDEVDWDQPLPTRPAALDRGLLARAGAVANPVATTVAHSRGPRALLNRVTPMLEDGLAARLETGLQLSREELGIRITAPTRRTRRLLLDIRRLDGWTVHRANSDVVVATRRVPVGVYARVNSLVLAEVVDGALGALDWPLSAWTLATRSAS